ncbi:MAG: hypothetical protein K6G88_14285 [Lachnospiraceae bacterium]|nr:hypothetical protein [Lachnospiraceae bacterium]
MKKRMKRAVALMLAGTLIAQPMQIFKQADKVVAAENDNPVEGTVSPYNIPAASTEKRIGAALPYLRYDSTKAQLGGGAQLRTSTDWSKDNVASQASEQSYVALPSSGDYAEWTIGEDGGGSGVTMRFTMPDSSDGMGLNGSVDVYVNGRKVKTVDLTSYYMWQYFPSGQPSDTPGGAACFAFDEVHFKLNTSLKEGDKIRIQSTKASGLEYGVDFLEIEEVPAMIKAPADSVSVEDFGATPDDGRDDLAAFKSAVSYADQHGYSLYIPAGTFHLSGIWAIGCNDLKITGAGIWYTNLQFTSDQKFGGGISGGNSSYVADGYCKKLDFSNVYINSNLRSRYGEQAVYKCFMDVFADGSVIHDIWEEHFECGFWFGDYNGSMDYSDGVKVINSRIRNNLADGVNFCQGTSNATVYNCSIRNNGDDGLAMWNNSEGAKEERNNTFAYNTIDFVWRAGGIAIYGGDGHKIYNNYICDMYMGSGIHLNTTFPGYKFSNTSKIQFDNNILVRSGTNSDAWGEDLSAVDIKQDVKNVVFNNTAIYDSPFTAIRLLNSNMSGIVFNDTKIYGAGLAGQEITFSCNKHSAVAIREDAGASTVFNRVDIANIAPDKYANDPGQKNTTWPYWTDRQTPGNLNDSNVTLRGAGFRYEVPPYPDKSHINPPEPIPVIKGTDIQVTGLAWVNQEGKSELNNGDEVTFRAYIYNDSDVVIPDNVPITFKVTVDGDKIVKSDEYYGGLGAHSGIVLETKGKWNATAGGHTIVAYGDDGDVLIEEINENNNTRTKKFNVAKGGHGGFTKVTGGYDLVVTDVTCNRDSIAVGDNLVFTATVANAGDRDIPAGTVIGYQVQIDDNTSEILWCDTYSSGIKAGETVDLTVNSGSKGINYWTAQNGHHKIMIWVDDVNRITGEVDENNNKFTTYIDVPYQFVTVEADETDKLEDPTTEHPTENPTEVPTTEKPTEKPTEQPEEIKAQVEINGYQISATAKGMRTVYSISDPKAQVAEVGLVYGLKDECQQAEMVINSANADVHDYQGTSKGKIDENMSDIAGAQSYVMTMMFGNVRTEFYTTDIYVRAYAKLTDGRVIYSGVEEFNTYKIAQALYRDGKMGNLAGHEYLYNEILSVVTPGYPKVDFNWANAIAKPSDL